MTTGGAIYNDAVGKNVYFALLSAASLYSILDYRAMAEISLVGKDGTNGIAMF